MFSADNLIRTACKFYGEHEIIGNLGFENPVFQKIMERAGWKPPQSWCAYFIEACLREAGYTNHADILDGSAVKTFQNCKASPLFKIYSIPSNGDIVIWQNYINGLKDWTGHAGLIVGMGRGLIACIEGNTNASGGREGIEVAIKVRDPAVLPVNGLRLVGFIRLV